jgi:hypothetical protein
MAESFISVLVIRHPDGVSSEGAIHQRLLADKALQEDVGLEVVGATTGLGEASAEAMKVLRGVWGIEDA